MTHETTANRQPPTAKKQEEKGKPACQMTISAILEGHEGGNRKEFQIGKEQEIEILGTPKLKYLVVKA